MSYQIPALFLPSVVVFHLPVDVVPLLVCGRKELRHLVRGEGPPVVLDGRRALSKVLGDEPTKPGEQTKSVIFLRVHQVFRQIANRQWNTCSMYSKYSQR